MRFEYYVVCMVLPEILICHGLACKGSSVGGAGRTRAPPLFQQLNWQYGKHANVIP